MGKHERALIEKAEKIIVKILKSEKLTGADTENHWFVHARAIAKKIKADFPRIDSVSHLGNHYDNTGDVLLTFDGEKSFIETKMSDTKTGIGTMANISQNALTDNGLFEGNVKNWSSFRADKKHDKWVNSCLDQYGGYPKIIIGIENSAKRKEEKAKYLRKLSKKGNKKAKIILDNIQKRDKKEKVDYLEYLNNQKQQSENIKKFFVLIIIGVHKQKILKDLIGKKNLLAEVRNLFIYYANSHDGKVIIRREDAGEKIAKILKKYLGFKIVFPKGLTHCKIIGIKGKMDEPLMQIVFHWKNIGQGIKTPCLNIFGVKTNDS